MHGTADYEKKSGDLLPPIEVTLLGPDRQPVDISSAAGVDIIWRRAGTATRNTATIDNAAAGDVSYHWQAGDEALAPGDYRVEFEVDLPNGPLTFPNAGPHAYMTMKIWPDLD
jgi:hypothetical protein